MSTEAESNNQVDNTAPEVREAIEKIKQPPSINEMLMEENPEELLSNPAVVPEKIDDIGELRSDIRRDK